MMITAWHERDGERVEVLATEALADPDQVYRCLACNGQLFPKKAEAEGGPQAVFEHAADAAPCRRNPRRQDRRLSMRVGGRRADD